jgi:hypothetical protein
MSPHHLDAEDALEAATVALFAELGWDTANAYSESFPGSAFGRETAGEVVLRARLRPALERLNPALPREAIEQAVEELARDRSALSLAQANREVYALLRGGVKVHFRDEDGADLEETARVVDWGEPAHNDFLLVQQFWVTGELHKRRPDLVGFVNGLPLVLVELKAHTRQLENAYQDNLRDYRDTIPQIFWYNALIMLSNGVETRVGSLSSKWEHFAEWKKISDEDEPGVISLETVIRGTCEKRRLLDLVENFTLFSDTGGALVKLLAKNHQFLGVNNAVDAVRNLGENQGRLGVFWHTQGSGKSYSMIFFAQKVLRKLPGNWTFVVVTDRTELDRQIYKNFASVGAVTEPVGERDQDLEVAHRLALRLDELVDQVVAALGARVDALLLHPHRGGQQHVRQLRGGRGVHRLRHHEEALLHPRAVLGGVGQRVARVGAHDQRGLEVAVVHCLEHADRVVARLRRDAAFRHTPVLLPPGTVLRVGDHPAERQRVREGTHVAHPAARVGLSGQRERTRARPADLAGQQMHGVEHAVGCRAVDLLVDAHGPQAERGLRIAEALRRLADVGRAHPA